MFFFIMLLFPEIVFYGASNGLLLWFQSILPTLLPFIMISNLLIYSNATYYISCFLRPVFQKLFGVSVESCYAILVGFLCGYPMGAKTVSDLVKQSRITRNEGQYLLSFCNNTSPMFLVSFLALQNFKNSSLIFATLFISIFSPIICSFFFRIFYRKHANKTIVAQKMLNTDIKKSFKFSLIDDSIMNGFETITKVGGYIILFSILFSLGKQLPFTWFLPCLEISNGIPWIMDMDIPFYIAFPFALGVTSFGGFCAIMQTYSMIQESKLQILPYIIQKLITAMVTSLIAFCYIRFIHQ